MSKKLYTVAVRGKTHEWALDVYAKPRDAADWREDGLDVGEVVYTIPLWVAQGGQGITRLWCFGQDILHFRNPFSQ